MNIPKSIKDKIIKCANYHEKANIMENEIREWMHKNNIYTDGNIDQLIDTVAQTNNPDLFITHLENNVFIGNDECYESEFKQRIK